MKTSFSRRRFLAASLASAATTLKSARARPEAVSFLNKGPLVCVFSKHLQFLDYTQLAKTCKALGLDGVDLTVRKGGHVTPEKVATDLPRAVEALRAHGLEVPMITTSIHRGDDPDARPILEAASRLSIPYFRIGGHKYSERGSPIEQLPKFSKELGALAALAKEQGMIAGYHNHSGKNELAAALWDLHLIIREVGLDSLGSNFDTGHATVEGGLGVWRINARLMAPHVKMMAVKDFVWQEGRVQWCPLGRGQVKTGEILKVFREAGFAGPISMHFEYDTASNDALLEEIQRTAATLRAALQEAGYAHM